MMDEQAHSRLRDEDLAFLGAIGAHVSHDIRNVLSVIGQYAGLLDDLLGLAERGKALDQAKLKKLAGNIALQVDKGTMTMERFSQFAHAADERTSSFDVTAVTGNTAALAQRHAALLRCRLETELPGEEIRVTANPFALQHALFVAIQLILGSVDEGQIVHVTLARHGSTAVIRVSGQAPGQSDLSGQISRLEEGMAELNGNATTTWADGTVSLTLTIPIE